MVMAPPRPPVARSEEDGGWTCECASVLHGPLGCMKPITMDETHCERCSRGEHEEEDDA